MNRWENTPYACIAVGSELMLEIDGAQSIRHRQRERERERERESERKRGREREREIVI